MVSSGAGEGWSYQVANIDITFSQAALFELLRAESGISNIVTSMTAMHSVCIEGADVDLVMKANFCAALQSKSPLRCRPSSRSRRSCQRFRCNGLWRWFAVGSAQ